MINSISAVILAGGQAKRMGGIDKGLLLWQGKPLFQHVYQRLLPQLADISINTNRNLTYYAKKSGLTVFSDRLEGFQGPLSGILTALERSTTDFVLFVPCDCPFLPLNLLEKLEKAINIHQALLAYAHDGEREHPTFCLISTQLSSVLANYLARDERRMRYFMKENGAIAVDFSEQRASFKNINYLQDLE